MFNLWTDREFHSFAKIVQFQQSSGNLWRESATWWFDQFLLFPPPLLHAHRQRHSDTETKTKKSERFTRPTLSTMFDYRSLWPSTMVSCAASLINTYVCYHEPPRTQQHSKWNCVGANRPQHMLMYSLVACGWTLNTRKNRIVQKNSVTTEIEFESDVFLSMV